jgi:hypothetical protein
LILAAMSVGPAAAAVEDVAAGISSAYSSTAAVGDTVHLVYYREAVPGNTEIYYRRSTDGGDTWGSELALTSAAGASISPSVAASGTRVYVVWSEARDGNAEIYFKMSSDSGATWTADRRVTNASGDSLGPAIAVGPSRIHVAWLDRRDGNREVYYASGSPDGTTWTPDARLTNTAEESTGPSIVADGATLHVVWKESNYIAHLRSNDEGATWSSQTQLSHPGTEYLRFSDYPRVSASGGQVVVVWIDNRSSDTYFGSYDLYAITSSSAGASWGTEHPISGGATSTTVLPAVEVRGAKVRVVWPARLSPGNWNLLYLKSEDGGNTWATPATLEVGGPATPDRPSLARTALGSRLHMAWTSAELGNDALNNPRIHYTHLDEGPDLDVYDNALDVQSNVLWFRSIVASDADVRVAQFKLVNSSASANPDPDGPSEAASIGDLRIKPRRHTRPAPEVEKAFLACFKEARPGWGFTVPAGKTAAFVNLVSATGQTVPVGLLLPTALQQGEPKVGYAVACLVAPTRRGIYAQTISVGGRSNGTWTTDTLDLRLKKGWW